MKVLPGRRILRYTKNTKIKHERKLFLSIIILSWLALEVKEAIQLTEKELQKLVRAVRAEYAREWRAKNPDKTKEYNRRYWERKAKAMAEAAARAVQ